MDTDLLRAVAGAGWDELTAFFRDTSPASRAQQRRAVQAVCAWATQRDIIRYVLSDCAEPLLDCVLEQLLSRGLWWAVGTLLALQRPLSEELRRGAVQRAVQEATTWEISDFILPHLDEHLWPFVARHLLQRQLWWAVGKVLRARRQVFICRIHPICTDVHLNSLMTHLVSTDQMQCTLELLYASSSKQSWDIGQTKVSSTLLLLVAKQRWTELGQKCQDLRRAQRAWAVQQLCKRAPKEYLEYHISDACTGNEVPAALKHLVNRKITDAVAYMLCSLMAGVLLDWTTARGEESEEEEFWDLVINHRYDCKDLCALVADVRKWKFIVHDRQKDPRSISVILGWDRRRDRDSLKVALCEAAMDAVIVALFYHKDTFKRSRLARQQADFAISKMMNQFGRFARDQRMGRMESAIRQLCAEFGRTSLDYSSPLFTVHVARNLLHTCYKSGQRYGQKDIILVLLACVPINPAVQGAALTVMLSDKRWDVVQMADLSYVREQVRRQLLSAAMKQKQWGVVKQWIHSTLYDDQRGTILRKAEEDKQTDVVRLLTEQGRSRAEPDTDSQQRSLQDMVEEQQWLECRRLIEQTVRGQQWKQVTPDCPELTQQAKCAQQCVLAIPQLVEWNQWLLVARVLELHTATDDAVRRWVMSQAMERGEGSVVSQCLRTMQQMLSVTERDTLFQQAVVTQAMQAVKPLVEEKDDTGKRHRDIALLEAIEQHQWDVVDHCLMHGSDINGHGENNLMYLLANDENWDAVDELSLRGGDPAILSKGGYSVMHCVIAAQQWDLLKLLIKRGGNIHLHAAPPNPMYKKFTAVQRLCDLGHWEMIEFISTCSPRVREANEKGETLLHTVCLYGLTTSLRKLFHRGVNPAAVTERGHSALSYAVIGADPQTMVAECIRLGLSTTEPSLTSRVSPGDDHHHPNDSDDIGVVAAASAGKADRLLMSSPLVLAAVQGLPVVTKMLYESGTCSTRDLHTLQALFHELDPASQTNHLFKSHFRLDVFGSIFCYHGSAQNQLAEQYSKNMVLRERREVALTTECVRYLSDMSSRPRSLKSLCRLVISRCLGPGLARHSHVQQLPVYDSLKKYLEFDDVIKPHQATEDREDFN